MRQTKGSLQHPSALLRSSPVVQSRVGGALVPALPPAARPPAHAPRHVPPSVWCRSAAASNPALADQMRTMLADPQRLRAMMDPRAMHAMQQMAQVRLLPQGTVEGLAGKRSHGCPTLVGQCYRPPARLLAHASHPPLPLSVFVGHARAAEHGAVPRPPTGHGRLCCRRQRRRRRRRWAQKRGLRAAGKRAGATGKPRSCYTASCYVCAREHAV